MPKVAVLYQSSPPPSVDGIIKPMKPGGYADSGADITYALQGIGIDVAHPVPAPRQEVDTDWVFPDSPAGMDLALEMGATVFWLNTVLYAGHPIEGYFSLPIEIVGQSPAAVGRYDDKLLTNDYLRNNGLPVPQYTVLSPKDYWEKTANITFPIVIKPIRGRGSQGVSKAENAREARTLLKGIFAAGDFGDKMYAETFLSGHEITISVLPPGLYQLNDQQVSKEDYWCLPPVARFNHDHGIAPYNGTVAVMDNSRVLKPEEILSQEVQAAQRACAEAARLVGAKAVIRIDCRADTLGRYFLFDLNMKPNMTGNKRHSREDQLSLTGLAARGISWSYEDLLTNLLNQRWAPKE